MPADIACGRLRDRWVRACRQEARRSRIIHHHCDADRLIRTRLHARRCFTGVQTIAAHVALAHDAARRRIFRHFIWARENAVLAADALIVQVTNNPGARVLFIREHGAAREAAGVDAMMARSRDNLLEWIAPIVADQQASLSPGFALVQAVKGMARRDARFATAAFVEVDLESELLSCARQRQRN